VAVGHQKYIQKPQQNEFKQQTQFQKALAFFKWIGWVKRLSLN